MQIPAQLQGSPKPNVICLGLSALDQVWQMEGLFTGGSQKIRAADHSVGCGGMAANAAVAVARLGGNVRFWGRGGDDTAGAEMKREFQKENVDTEGFRLFPGGRSSVSAVLVDESGERQIANFRGRYPEAADWLPVSELDGVGAVLADPRWVEGAATLFKAARARGIPTVLDGDVSEKSVFETLLPLTDHAIFSEPGLARFAGSDVDAALKHVSTYGCQVSAVTLGAEGVVSMIGGIMHRQPGFAVEVVDTTGAGDVFHGAYAFATAAACSPLASMTFASACAALKCTRAGGRNGIPTLDECLTYQRSYS